jgi:hypothetical protein
MYVCLLVLILAHFGVVVVIVEQLVSMFVCVATYSYVGGGGL